MLYSTRTIQNSIRSKYNISTSLYNISNNSTTSTSGSISIDYLNLILSNKYPDYAGIVYGYTSVMGTHGSVTGDTAIYFINKSSDGFIFKNGSDATGNVMSIDKDGNLVVEGNIIAKGEISAFGEGNITSGTTTGGLIDNVYDVNDLTGVTFSNDNLTDTFNAFTTKKIYDDVVSIQNQINNKTSDKNYIYEQGLPATEWTVVHNLQKYPSVSVIDSGNTLVEGSVNYVNNNQIVITFSYAFSGKAYLN